MATFASLLADVITVTKRPDLVDQTTLAVKAATLKAHHSDFYPKDLFESGVQFTTSDYLQSLEYKALIPRYRALKYIRKTDIDEALGPFLTVITPEQSLDSYGVNKEDVVYLAGSVLNIKSSTNLQYIILGCYLHPDVTALTWNSWIAEDHPFAIIYEAISIVFKGIGYDEQASMYQKLVADQYAELKIDSVIAQGY